MKCEVIHSFLAYISNAGISMPNSIFSMLNSRFLTFR